jgi:hypothetical protein
MLTSIPPMFFIQPANGESDSTEGEQARFYGFFGELRHHYDVREEIAAGSHEGLFNDGELMMAYLATGDSWEYMCVFCYGTRYNADQSCSGIPLYAPSLLRSLSLSYTVHRYKTHSFTP